MCKTGNKNGLQGGGLAMFLSCLVVKKQHFYSADINIQLVTKKLLTSLMNLHGLILDFLFTSAGSLQFSPYTMLF